MEDITLVVEKLNAFDKKDFISTMRPRVIVLLTNIKDLISERLEEHFSVVTDAKWITPPIVEQFDSSKFYTHKVKEVWCYHCSITDDNNWGEDFDDDKFDREELCVRLLVLLTDDKVYVSFPTIQLPIHLRSKGIYTDIIKKLKVFMSENNLGNIIGLSDASEDDGPSTSDIAGKYGILCDPFLEERHGLAKE